MNDHPERIVAVGGGLAAAKAVQSLRERGYTGPLTLVGEEAHRPYERPPLSKKVLAGDADPGSAFVHDPDFYTQHDIELLTGEKVTELDRTAATLTTTSGRTLGFDRLLLATGAAPRQLPVTDADLDGIHTLRTLDDAQTLHDRLRAAGHVTIVGAGWIGCEVAAAARRLDTAVTIVDPLDTPLERVLGPEVGAIFAQLHRDHDVDLRTGVGVSGAVGTGRVERVTLTDDTVIDTDLVVVGIGVVPRTELADRAGLGVDNGILADATLTTSDPRIVVAGDVANADHPFYGRHLRVEHWANALNQGEAAAATLLGDTRAYDRLPYFFTDQYDLGMEYVGHATDWDQVVIRGDTDTREFIAFWLSGQRVVAAMNVNVWDVVDDLKQLITSRTPVEANRLRNADVPLDSIPATRD